jgi:hypothetical protein
MNARRLALVTLVAAFAGAIAARPLAAQGSDRPSRGKIDEVERASGGHDRGRSSDSDDGEGGGGWFLFRLIGHLFCGCNGEHPPAPATGAPAPTPHGQGYLPYPYAAPRARETFVLADVTRRRAFGSFAGSYFRDDVSTLRAGAAALEAAHGMLYSSLEYVYHREPKANETDYLHLWRAGLGAMPRLGRVGYLKIGLAARGVVLDNGRSATGPELELGAKVFPQRPWAVAATGRVAALSWDHESTFAYQEWSAAASVFVGRVEIEGGAHWTRLGIAPAFYGPTLGARVWF